LWSQAEPGKRRYQKEPRQLVGCASTHPSAVRFCFVKGA
jgi:hypothetical protein